jgi:hypothetical protein
MQSELVFRLATLFVLVAAASLSVSFRHRAEREGGVMRSGEGQRLVVILRLLGLIVLAPLFAYLINPGWVAWARLDLPQWLRWLASGGRTGPAADLLLDSRQHRQQHLAYPEYTRRNHQLVSSRALSLGASPTLQLPLHCWSWR